MTATHTRKQDRGALKPASLIGMDPALTELVRLLARIATADHLAQAESCAGDCPDQDSTGKDHANANR